jgi:hypothetical protein
MNDELTKAANFVSRLLANPALGALPPLQKEEQILQFLQINRQALYPTLSSPQFFPGYTWENISLIMEKALMETVNQNLVPQLQGLVRGSLDLSFIAFLRQQNVTADAVKNDLLQFLGELLANPSVRREFSGSYNSLVYHVTDKYIEQVFQRKEYVHFELTKVQRLRMGKEEVKNLIRVSLLLKPAVYLFSVPGAAQQEIQKSVSQPQFTDRVLLSLTDKLRCLPPEVLSSAVNANLSFLDNQKLEATARISAIINNLCRNYRPDMPRDRGADTMEKSWLSVARKNHRFYGFDVKVLDEFYKIAGENNW